MKAWENVGQSRADALASAILAAAFPPLSDGVHAESKPAAVADNIRTNGFNFIWIGLPKDSHDSPRSEERRVGKVCPYVWISVVPVSLKKKKSEQRTNYIMK